MPKRSLEELYKSLPTINCKRLCQECCGPVIPSALLPAEAVKFSILPIISVRQDLTCGALLLGQCSVYSNRPLICRLYGCVEAMRCPFGCEPAFWMTDEQVEEILREQGEYRFIGKIHAGQKAANL